VPQILRQNPAVATRREIDSADRMLLDVVQSEGRASLKEIAARVHLGVSATRARLNELVTDGVIRWWTAKVEPERLGFALHAVVRMKVHGALYDKVSDVLAREPQIVRCLRVTGEACYIAEILARDMKDLARITSELARIGSITTDLVYEVVADRPVPTGSEASTV